DLDRTAGAQLLDSVGELLEADPVRDERGEIEAALLEEPDRVGEDVLPDEAAYDRQLAARDPDLADLGTRALVDSEEQDPAAGTHEVESRLELRSDRVDDDVRTAVRERLTGLEDAGSQPLGERRTPRRGLDRDDVRAA